jgi:excisionase family DNA binding protein
MRRVEQIGGGDTKMKARMTIEEIALRLAVGKRSVYAMLERGLMPGVRLGRRWIVTRHAYETWERTCGLDRGEFALKPSEDCG